MRMKTEYQKMLDGEVYSAVDKELLEMLNRVKDLCWEYNQIRPTLIKERNLKLREILGKMDDDTFINQPFYCDYGKHIRVGKRFFANFGLTVLDEAYVTIGDNCWIGGGATILPGVSIGSGCTIGAGSVVVHDIPDNSVAVGNPAKVVKKV